MPAPALLGALLGTLLGTFSGRCGLLAVGFKAGIDQRDLGVDRRMAQTLLLGNQLHQLVGTLDIGGAIVERARSRCRSREALRSGGVFLERNQILRLGAKLDA